MRGVRPRHASVVVPGLAALAVAAAAACARPSAPPGGQPDLLPPVVVATRPDTFDDLEVVEDPIRIRFNERISERPTQGTLDDAVLVSPLSGEVSVDHGRNSLEVDMSGGFRPGLVYRVTVLPVIQDMFNNAMREPFEFVFSTGGTLHPNAVAGVVVDRITGEPVADARVQARMAGEEEGPLHVSRTDSGGIFALRYMEPGPYEVVAYQDRDRDQQVDSFEVQGERTLILGRADTLITDLVVLAPDTSRARLARAQMEDSTVLRLAFDDYVSPLSDLQAVQVSIRPVPDTVAPSDTLPRDTVPALPPRDPEVVRILHGHQYRAYLDTLAAEAAEDTAAAADTAAADTADAPARARPAETPLPELGAGAARGSQQRTTLPDGTPLPSQSIFVLLDVPPTPGVPYEVTASGVVNVNQLTGGGGGDTLVRTLPPPDTVATPDALAPGDTLVSPDTGGVQGDTSAAPPPDTMAVPPDTMAVPPDTMGAAPPDTMTSPGRVAGPVRRIRSSGGSPPRPPPPARPGRGDRARPPGAPPP